MNDTTTANPARSRWHSNLGENLVATVMAESIREERSPPKFRADRLKRFQADKNTTGPLQVRLRRCLHLLNMLQSGIGYSISHLARQLEVSKRTIYRDFQILEEAGIPIRYDPIKRGHILQRHVDFCASNLSSDEMTALLLAAHISSLVGVQQINRPLHQAIGKLLTQMPIRLREDIGNLLNSIRGSRSSTLSPEGLQSVLGEILSALREKRRVCVLYEPAKDAALALHTEINPDCLMITEGRWYLVGHSSWHRKAHRFDLEHIRLSERADDSHELPETTQVDAEQTNWPGTDARDGISLASFMPAGV